MDLPAVLLALAAWISTLARGEIIEPSDTPEAYFNGSAYIRMRTALSLHSNIGLSFRSCVGGELFSQRHISHDFTLTVSPDRVSFLFKMAGKNPIEANLYMDDPLDNRWHYVGIVYQSPNLIMTDEYGHTVIIANETHNSEILNTPEYENEAGLLIVGNSFSGCMLEGPSLVFRKDDFTSYNIRFEPCPLITDKCSGQRDVLAIMPVDHCYNEPCMRHGVCISKADRYECRCASRYAGNNCQIDSGPPCSLKPCLNRGTCEETKEGNYICFCAPGYHGEDCQYEVSTHPLCVQKPCFNNGTCQVSDNGANFECTCEAGFTGFHCETNIDECLTASQPPCQNGGICNDAINGYTCNCTNTGYEGDFCQLNVNECKKNPCLNGGVCFDTYGGYVCHCQSGFTGNNCQSNQNECLSSPCLNGGICKNMDGTYHCICPKGTVEPRCTLRRSVRCVDTDCPPHSTCVNNSASTAVCVCNPGYVGTPGRSPNCTLSSGTDCRYADPCVNGGTCNFNSDEDTFNCTCPPGYSGKHCELSLISSEKNPAPWREPHMHCTDRPCAHAISCEDHATGYYCNCEPGWTGANCESNINECLSNPCQNGGECMHSINSFRCNCAPGYTGRTCQTAVDLCSIHRCQNGGTCIYTKNNTSFFCECPVGFKGTVCEENIDDCVGVTCPDYQVCYDGINSYTCHCPEGFTGENCTLPTDFCASNPCVNGTCKEGGGGNNYTCTCNMGYMGRNCESDIDECKVSGICNQGICINTAGSYECYCKPGFTGVNCDLDVDECLSRPCKNNGSCVNKVNNYECICTPGFTGKNCSININECESNPCKEGSTCVDGMATFTCLCMQGLTGPTCDVNIDDCESSPCLNGGICEDGLNNYTCNCDETGHTGPQCQHNINDCDPNPCIHGSTCRDLIKDYFCDCFPGYEGKRCEIDIPECESRTCNDRGVCLERSNISLYLNATHDMVDQPFYINHDHSMLLPSHFYQDFKYENASGFECVCKDGYTGNRCEIDINECESNPCAPWGTCVDGVGRYSCDCEAGFEGDDCRTDIDECARYKPCVSGICHDRRANYYCECEPGWGGKNCSVKLQGCAENLCLNNGTCHPWLHNETEHRFNCTCQSGYYGNTCEKITTMSLNGHSYVLINSTRDEGYDIQFYFKTTLGNGLLAIGSGGTYYILELVNGRLNLHSSILNRWEGVFIGSNLNDSNWQKVFVSINSSHLVLSAYPEQTIYPITVDEGTNSTTYTFPTTYLGGSLSSYSRLTHGPAAFVGCVKDVIINGEWVLPDDSSLNMKNNDSVEMTSQSVSWYLHGVQPQCPRVNQCGPKNPCHSNGRCTDLWTSFHCSCQRPYLGHTCQYNLTAATFGHENITNSLVTVMVHENARRAVRSIVDISMFIRTNKASGQIFYLGSKPRNSSEETFVAASLENGELVVRLQFDSIPEAYAVGGNRLDNGHNHLIQVIRNSTLVQVKINGTEYFRKSIFASANLEAQVLYLGGQPLLIPIRAVRQVEILPSSTINVGSTNIHGNLRAEPTTANAFFNYPQTDHFKGIIQDVQISNGSRTMIIEFFPLRVSDLDMPLSFGLVTFDNNSVLEGVISDDSCAINPCEHNGTCQITWNDFRCVCPRGYKGKACQDMEFCQLQDCPEGSACHNLDDGYECIANVTFNGHNTTLSYNLTFIEDESKEEESFSANSITIEYRSRTGGTLLHIENLDGSEMVSISVFRDQVAVAWRLGTLQIPKLKRFHKSEPDFQWTRIHIVISKNHIKGGFGDWLKDDSPGFTSDFDYDAWLNLLKNGEIHVGGVRPLKENISDNDFSLKNRTNNQRSRSFDPNTFYMFDSGQYQNDHARRVEHQNDGLLNTNNVDLLGFDVPYSTETGTVDPQFWSGSEASVGENFKGCIGELRIGDLLLPFYSLTKMYPNNNLLLPGKYYFSLQNENDKHNSSGCILCFNDECLNGGVCTEPTTNYTCTCPLGFKEDNCGIDINECATAQCHNNSTCMDKIGNYTCLCQTGWEGWLCDIDIDECASQPCKNGGTCTDLPGGFLCMCPEEFTGKNCISPRLRTCTHEPCRAGSTCKNEKDLITGNNFTCSCMDGFEGTLCDIPYCVVRPCLNGGMCESLPDTKPTCKCPPGFTGKFCGENINECHSSDGSSPCLNGGRCIDGIASYSCDCYDTGFTGNNCEEDIDECSEGSICGDGGTCVNINGSYDCLCGTDKCGNNCSLPDPCTEIRNHNDNNIITDNDFIKSEAFVNATINRGPCENGGKCKPRCKVIADYECQCIDGWGGKNCSERSVVAAKEEGPPIGIIVGAVVGGLCALGGIGLFVACMLARSKRATRGTYSPSGQEYRNPRLEMLDSVLKPPPEERLI